MRRARRTAFTIIEIMFVGAVASVILIVLMNMFTGVQKNVGNAEKTLDFLRKASILLDRVRHDIRSAGRGDTVKTGNPTIIQREAASGKSEKVTYEFNPEGRFVIRTVSGGKNDTVDKYGADGSVGFILRFAIDDPFRGSAGSGCSALGVKGLYVVDLEFASEEDMRAKEKGAAPKAVQLFKALVSKRAPEVTDDLWMPNDAATSPATPRSGE